MKRVRRTDRKDYAGNTILIGDILSYPDRDELIEVQWDAMDYRMWHTDQEIDNTKKLVAPRLYSQEDIIKHRLTIHYRDNKKFDTQKSLF